MYVFIYLCGIDARGISRFESAPPLATHFSLTTQVYMSIIFRIIEEIVFSEKIKRLKKGGTTLIDCLALLKYQGRGINE